MSNWSDVNNQAAIENLLRMYGGFHDSCITELRYQSGADVTADLSMRFGNPLDRKLYVILKRQFEPITIELLFEGMRQMNVTGWQMNYFCYILDCYLAFRNDLITGMDENLM